MSMLDGISQCWPLAKGCVVWWDAWAVIVGIAVGLATVAVAVLAWRTSERAALIASKATEIAKQQHEDSLYLREGTARVIAHVMASDLATVPQRIEGAIVIVTHVIQELTPLDSSEQFDGMTHRAPLTILRLEEAMLNARAMSIGLVEDRLHTLPRDLGNSVAAFWGAMQVTKAESEGMVRRISVRDREVFYRHHRGVHHFEALNKVLRGLHKSSIEISNGIQDFLGEPQFQFEGEND